MKKINFTLKAKIIYLELLSLTLLSGLMIAFSINNNENIVKTMTGEKMVSILNTLKVNIDEVKFEGIVKSKDDTNEYYEYLRKMLIQIKVTNELKYLYIMVKLDNDNFMYIVDANEKDSEEFSKLGDIGKIEDNGGKNLLITFDEGKDSYTDIVQQGKWGWLLSGFTAIKNSNNEIIGVIGGDISANVIKNKMSYFRNIIIIFAVVITLIISIFAVVLGKYISESLNKFLVQFVKGSEGDLTIRMEQNTKDEIGELSVRFNIFIGNISGIISEIRNYSMKVARGTEQLSATINQISGSIDDLGNSSNSTAAAIEEMSNTTTTVSQNVGVLLKSSEETLELAHNGGKAVKITVNGINKIKKVVEEGSRDVNKLGTKTNEIGEIVTVINDIAAQTNLLALNAAIEAARAGEAGRGFEVVAEEIRKLAEKTTISTKKIAKMVKEIQGETNGVIIKMEEVNAEVEEGVKTANNTGKALEEIVNQTENLRNMVNMIANSTKEQSLAAEEIAKQTENVANNVEENRKAIVQSSESIRDIASISEQLNQIVNQFKIFDDTIE